MRTPLRLPGTVASIGYAAGPAHLLVRAAAAYAPSGNAGTEAERLAAAVARAGAEIGALIAEAEADSAAILEFQVAMLEDESLVAPALAAVEAGIAAAEAWGTALDAEIAGYAAADDPYFRARSADLVDIRERVLDILCGRTGSAVPRGAVLVGEDISPTRFLAADWSGGGGIVLAAGSPTSHVAMLARARGIPMLVGAGEVPVAEGDPILLDAEHAHVIVRPDPSELAAFHSVSRKFHDDSAQAVRDLAAPAVTADGVTIAAMVNIAEPSDVDAIDVATCDGVGLMRTEFLFNDGLPDEDTQLRAYTRVLAWAQSKPVVIRTVDAGGDKPVPGFTREETNPFLGLRGIRLALSRPDVFRVQIRALLRAAGSGNLRVMLPMVTLASELAAARALFAEEAGILGVPVPPLGIMVEVPAVALAPDLLRDAAFFSIGSNDLTQYVMAAARDNGAVAALADATHPAVIGLVGNVARAAAGLGIPVSLCGDAGGDPNAIPLLLGAGLRSLSVAPAQLARAKAAIRGASTSG